MSETNIIKGVLEEERERNIRSQRAYADEIAKLPKGSLSVRKRGARLYCYMKYRDGEKVVTKYMGRAEDCEADLREQIAYRKELEKALRRLRHEQRYIEKALRHK